MAIQRENILSEIILNKKEEVAALSSGRMSEFRKSIDNMQPTRDFLGAISRPDKISIIAEIKKSSPSLGAMRLDTNVGETARLYEDCGASAVSVLTDRKYFSGSVEDLVEARKNIDIPILRKDFIIDSKQIFEARAFGADAVLLIVAALDDHELKDFNQVAAGLGLVSLIETHNADEIERALRLNPSIIGINNRCLKTLDIDLSTSEKLRNLIPDEICVISESGIKTKADILRLNRAGINAFLIGTSIIKTDSPDKALREFTGN